jgi:transglycosylase-like protein with SLT domain
MADRGYLERTMIQQFAVVFIALLASIPVLGQATCASEHDHLVAKHAAAHGVPESLVRRVIHIESKGNPRVVSAGNYGLMQIRLGTARAMGYGGDASGLLNADTNMTYAVRYLAGAYRAAGGNQEQAIRNYQRGYYYSAKAQGFSPYAAPSPAPSVLPQPAAPDPTMLRQQQAVPDPILQRQQQAIERQQIAEKQKLERHAMLEARVAQQKVAEEERRAQRHAALQARIEQQKAAEQARAAQRQAALQERLERQQALQQRLIEERTAAEQRRAMQRQAILQQRIEREQAQQQQRAAVVQARQVAAVAAVPVEAPRVVAAQIPPSAPAVVASPRRVAPAPAAYSWYNPMRFFKHPSHQANPYQRDR